MAIFGGPFPWLRRWFSGEISGQFQAVGRSTGRLASVLVELAGPQAAAEPRPAKRQPCSNHNAETIPITQRQSLQGSSAEAAPECAKELRTLPGTGPRRSPERRPCGGGELSSARRTFSPVYARSTWCGRSPASRQARTERGNDADADETWMIVSRRGCSRRNGPGAQVPHAAAHVARRDVFPSLAFPGRAPASRN